MAGTEKEYKLEKINGKIDSSKDMLQGMMSQMEQNKSITPALFEDDVNSLIEDMEDVLSEVDSQYSGSYSEGSEGGSAAERYTITFYSNPQDSGVEEESGTQQGKVGYYLNLRSNRFKQDHYKFIGWGKTRTQKTEDFKNRGAFLNTEKKDVSLYAIWEEILFTIEFNANSGTGTMSSQTGRTNTPITLKKCTFTKKNYNFLGWAKSASAVKETYADGGKYSQASKRNVTLYAVWKLATVTVTYNSNGGSGTMSPKTMTPGSTFSLDANKFARKDYEFKGWATTANGKVAYPDKGKITNLQNDITLYAIWEKSLAVSPLANAKAWNACSKASCWTNGNAKNRIMNILSPNMSSSTFESRYSWAKGRGVNCFHMFISNNKDGECSGYSIYGGSSASGSISSSFTNTMGNRIRRIFNDGYGVILWMMADDDHGWNNTHLSHWEQYCKDIKSLGWFQYCSTICIGLEINESVGTQSNIKSMVSTLKKYYSGKIGVHFGSSSDYSRAKDTGIDIIFGQITPSKVSYSTIKADIAEGKKYASAFNMFEICRTEDRANAQYALNNGAYGVGNW